MYNKKNLIFIIYILFLPFFLLLINETWAYNPFGWLDHWSYYGSGYYYPSLIQIFPHLPITELMPVNIFNSIFYSLFDPIGARLIRASLLLSIAVAFVFLITKTLTGSSFRGFLVSLSYATYLYTLSAVGSDYTEIFIQLELLFSISCILAYSTEKRLLYKNFLIIIFGFSLSLLIITAIISIVYILLLLIYFLTISVRNALILRNKLEILFLLLIGFFSGIFIFGYILYNLNGSMLLLANLQKLFSFVGGAYRAPDFGLWLNTASWLIFPTAVITTCIVYVFVFLLKNSDNLSFNIIREKPELLFILFSITIYFALVFINVIIKQWSLQFLYFGQTTPLYFISMGILLQRIDLFKYKDKYFLFSSYLYLCLVAYAFSGFSENSFSQIIKVFSYINFNALLSVTLLLALLLILAMFHRLFVPVFLSVFILFNIYSFSPAYGCLTCANGAMKNMNRPVFMDSNREILSFTVFLAKILEVHDYSRKSMIWFNNDDNLGVIARQAFAMNYLNNEYSLVNKEYPDLNNFTYTIGSGGTIPTAGRRILAIIFNETKCNDGLKSLQKKGFEILNYKEDTYTYNDLVSIRICEYKL
jgi:hypothetical protein